MQGKLCAPLMALTERDAGGWGRVMSPSTEATREDMASRRWDRNWKVSM